MAASTYYQPACLSSSQLHAMAARTTWSGRLILNRAHLYQQHTAPPGSRGFLNLPNLPNLPNFSSSPSTKAEPDKRARQVIRTQRTIPYPPSKVFELVADVDSYKAFVPYCQDSVVTARTAPSSSHGDGKRYPAQADLTVGWGPFTESYTSKLRCEPQNGIVEAISGDPDGQDTSDSRKPGTGAAGRAGAQPAANTGVFESLRTTWQVSAAAPPPTAMSRRPGPQAASTVAPDKREWSEVKLEVSFKFGNAAYGVVMDNFGAPLVETMINAFEKRAKQLYG